MNNIILNNIKQKLKEITFITTALPYANGNLHLGHLFESTIADIWNRNQTDTVYLSGDDQHGAAITLYAKKVGIKETEHIQNQYLQHIEQYKKLGVNFDSYGQTHNEFHFQLTQYLFKILFERKKIIKQPTLSWFDEQENQYLPDRYVRGQCPHCFAINQYPELCEKCNKHFSLETLINPKSILSGNTPVLKESIHYFLNTKNYYSKLRSLLSKTQLCEEAKNKLLDGELKNKEFLDISRDKPYFGIPIPNNEEQAFYVWFDAPIAYLSFTLSWIKDWTIKNEQIELNFEELIQLLPDLKFKHLIGKDIIYFHTYYWLNLLDELAITKVQEIKTHGWITDNGEKLSKSKGNQFSLNSYDNQQIDALRFYFFNIYENNIRDVELSFNDVWNNYNQIIIGKYVNIYSRVSKIIEIKQTELKIEEIENIIKKISKDSIYQTWLKDNEQIKSYLKEANFKKANKLFITLLNNINAEIQLQTPWKSSAKEALVLCYQVYAIFLEINTWLSSITLNLGGLIKTNVSLLEIKDNSQLNINHQVLALKIKVKELEEKI